jgi:hypothetical protein
MYVQHILFAVRTAYPVVFSVCTTYLLVVCTASPCFSCPYSPFLPNRIRAFLIKADNYSGFYKLFILWSCQYQLEALSTYHVKYRKCLLVEISPMQQISLQLEGGCSDMTILKKNIPGLKRKFTFLIFAEIENFPKNIRGNFCEKSKCSILF